MAVPDPLPNAIMKAFGVFTALDALLGGCVSVLCLAPFTSNAVTRD
jgi:hypothetical protein